MRKILAICILFFGAIEGFSSALDLTKSKGINQEVISSVTPAPGSTVGSDTIIQVQFTIGIDLAHVKKNDIKLKRISPDVKMIDGEVNYNSSTKTLSFLPKNILEEGNYEIEYKSLKALKDNKDTKIEEIKYRFNVIPVVLKSVMLTPNTLTLEPGENSNITILGNYSNGKSIPLSDVEWLISDNTIISVDSTGEVTAFKEGTATLKAKVGSVESNEISIEVKSPVVLQSISITPNPIWLRVGQSGKTTVEGLYSDGSRAIIEEGIEYTLGSYDVVTLYGDGELEALQEGSTTLRANVGDVYSPVTTVTVAKEIDTTNFNFTNFGSSYLEQIPGDATVESYDEQRFCMIAGQILNEDGSALQGVKVSIHQHPEYGTAFTDSNGTYVIPSEGGVQLTMRYTKEGYTTIDRNVQAPLQDWVRTPNVTMLTLDTKVTQIDLNNATPQIHVSTLVVDERGERSTTLVFDGVSKATVTSPDGTTRELTNLNVRATEFKTPESMPSDLPVESAYTYCSDLQVDGVNDNDEVSFDAPVVMYVENFLGFDVGEIVPVGYYDRNQGKWIGSENGVVVSLLDTDSDGKVDALDSTGDNLPNDLNGNGSTSDEVAGIENNTLYTAGKSYWRVEMMHFTPWDHNWPYAPPEDAEKPKQEDPKMDDEEPNDCKVDVSSYVTGKSRVFHEDIPVTGTDITLHYSSKRVDGYQHIIDASVDTSNLPASVQGAIVTLSVAGKTYIKEPDLTELDNLKFVWDGKDALGKMVSGEVTATIKVSYTYELVYLSGSQSFSQAWAKVGSTTTGVRGRSTIEVSNSKSIKIKSNNSSLIAKGWTLSTHDEALRNILLRGDGTVETKSKRYLGIITTQAIYPYLRRNIAVDDEGNIYISESTKHVIRKVDTSGAITIVAGNGTRSFSGDGGDATQASLSGPQGIAVDSKGNLYIADTGNHRIRKVDSTGIITTVAGSSYGFSGDGGYATQASLAYPRHIAIDNKGNFYISDNANCRIRKIDSAGIITTVAGNGWNVLSGDGGNATQASLANPLDIAVDNAGNLYIVDGNNYIVRKVDSTGIITTFYHFLGRAGYIDTDNNNGLYISESSNNIIRKVDSAGFVATVAGNGISGFSGDGEISTQASLSYPQDVVIDNKDNLYIADSGNRRIRKVTVPPLFKKYSLSLDHYLFLESNNIAEIFDSEGKHLKTIDQHTGNPLKAFDYDENNRLISITNNFGEVTTITRDANGNPTLITAPNGQQTHLSIDEQGNLIEVRYEDSSSYNFTYFDGALMDVMIDPNGNQIQHIFNDKGRIVEEIDGEGGSYKFLRNITGKDTFYTTIQPEGETQMSRDTILANGDTSSTITLPTGETVTATFTRDESSVSSIKDGVITQSIYEIDPLIEQRRLASKEIIQPSGLKNTTTYVVNYDGNKTHTNAKAQTITTNGKVTTIVNNYNEGTNVLTTAEGRIATRTYDINNLLTSSMVSGTLTPTLYTYDEKGRVTKESKGTRETTYTYDAKGNIASITDPRGNITTFTYDIMDRVTTVVYPNGTVEEYTYDSNSNMTKRVVPTPADHTFTYNGVNSRTSYTSPLQKATTYTYDKNKRVTAITKPSGATIANTYDKGRLVNTTTPEGTTSYDYLFADKVGSISKGSESLSYTYDGTLLTNIVQTGILIHTTRYAYNNDFKITSSTYAGATENYSYDKDGLLTSSGDYTLRRDVQNTYTTQVSDGTLTQNRVYNAYGEITQVIDNTFTYELSQRDNSGAITQKKETVNGITTTYDYIFDDMGRLTEVQKDGALAEEYTYDNNGNRASTTVNGVSTTASYTLDDQLEVYGDNTYRYDEDGYLQEKVTPEGTSTYTYGTLGELKSVVTPTKTIEYMHNALNQRVAKKVNGIITEKYLWKDLTTLLAVYDGSDNLVQRFEYADQRMPLSMISNGNKYYLHYDQVGSLRAVSDSSNNIIKEITYDTYGNILSDSNEAFKVPFGFAGGLYDADTKLTRFGYRDYDAYTGKWTAKDPIGFAGGDSNFYGYVLGDPVNFVDPWGLYDTNFQRLEYSGWKYGNNGRYKTLVHNGVDTGDRQYSPFEYYNGKSPQDKFFNGLGQCIVDHPDEIGLALSIGALYPGLLGYLLGTSAIAIDLLQGDPYGVGIGIGAMRNPIFTPIDIGYGIGQL